MDVVKTWVMGGSPNSIGAAIAEAVVSEGVDHLVFATTKEELDCRNWSDMADWVKEYGPFDRAVFAAGVSHLSYIDLEEQDMVRDVFNVNVNGFIGMLQALTSVQDYGNILAIVSDASRTPMRTSWAYCASKAALEMAVRCAARELAPWRINGLSPSTVEGTDMTRHNDFVIPLKRGWSPREARQYEMSMVPMKRRVTREEVAQAAIDILNGPEFMSGNITFLTGGKS